MKMIDLMQSISKSSSIALIIHINPDGDAIGSALALMGALNKKNKCVSLYCQDSPLDIYNFLTGIEKFKTPEEESKGYDLAIALDCSDRERMGSCSIIMDRALETANVDHHISNTLYADINIVDSNAAATGEIVFELISLLVDSKDKEIAEALYTSIISDTGRFSFSNTSAKTHRITAELIEWGVDIVKVTDSLFKNHSVEWVKLLGEAIDSLKLYHQDKVAIMHVTREMLQKANADEKQTSGIIQYAKDIEGVEIALVLREMAASTIKVSLRSQSFVDVSKLAEEFGGGGHKRAAGCTINLPLLEAEKNLMNKIDLLFEE